MKLEYFVSIFFFYFFTFFFSPHCIRRVFSSPLRVQCVHGNVAGELSHDTIASERAREQDQWLSITLNPNEYNPLICNPIIYYGIYKATSHAHWIFHIISIYARCDDIIIPKILWYMPADIISERLFYFLLLYYFFFSSSYFYTLAHARTPENIS